MLDRGWTTQRIAVALAGVALVMAGISTPARVAAVELSQTCVNPDVPFAVRFPSGWWVHPPDPERDISDCEYLGPVPFVLTEDDNGVLTGGTVVLHVVDGCVGDFRDIVSQRETTIAGRPATRIELAASEGDPTPGPAITLQYWIHLRGQECEAATTRYVVTSIGSNDPGAYAQNAAVLDAMMETFALGTTSDGAMSANAAWGPMRWLGVVLLAAAFWLGLLRFGQPQRRRRLPSRRVSVDGGSSGDGRGGR